ncbi:TAP-like protein-domain-containing protein [Rhypophila decipiens]|uniref:TAP-like protein-domain-containing protein n=1 Tax=Rhypophila decipiens TaxID=261697 RepID=A0AAN7B3B7_9PEZI|nr:TAP-like protein-domain-containing protein [Rhypophila decipiens]
MLSVLGHKNHKTLCKAPGIGDIKQHNWAFAENYKYCRPGLGRPILNSECIQALANPIIARSKLHQFNGSRIKWERCDLKAEALGNLLILGQDRNYPIECATLPVPLDYTNPGSDEKVTLELLRSPARNSPSRGSILLNFGGPGASGVAHLVLHAPAIHRFTSGYHDLVVFKPRGTGKRMKFSCGLQTSDEIDKLDDSIVPDEWTVSWNTTKVLIEKGMKTLQTYYKECAENNRNSSIGEYVGTTFVARDMIQIVDALGEDGLLRYWGISYGSILGVTVAAMLPERIDRLICDGVVDVFNYYNRMPVDSNYYLGADEKYHVERKTTSRPQQVQLLADRIESLWHRLHNCPIKVRNDVITSRDVIRLRDNLISLKLDATPNVDDTAKQLHALLINENLAEVVLGRAQEETLKRLVKQLGLLDIEAYTAIVCGDITGVQARPEILNGVLPQAQVAMNNSQFWGYKKAINSALCKDWPFDSKEKFNTSFLLVDGGVQTRKPGLFIGNTYDILTPLLNAKNTSSYFAGSAVLEQMGFGHGISDASSKCTLQAVKGYIIEGKLPLNNTICKEYERNCETVKPVMLHPPVYQIHGFACSKMRPKMNLQASILKYHVQRTTKVNG